MSVYGMGPRRGRRGLTRRSPGLVLVPRRCEAYNKAATMTVSQEIWKVLGNTVGFVTAAFRIDTSELMKQQKNPGGD